MWRSISTSKPGLCNNRTSQQILRQDQNYSKTKKEMQRSDGSVVQEQDATFSLKLRPTSVVMTHIEHPETKPRNRDNCIYPVYIIDCFVIPNN